MTDVVLEAGGGRVVALNRPEKLNAINEPTCCAACSTAVEQIGGDPAIGAAVLHGRGRAFSAGGDITAMAGMDEAAVQPHDRPLHARRGRVRGCPKPIVAAVHGHALAGGFELALICDLRIAAEDAVFGLPDAPLGLSPTSGMTYLLPRVIGLGPALELALCAENIGADRAATLGLVSRVVPGATLLAAAGDLAKRMATWPRVGLAMTKSGFYGALDGTFEEATAAEHAAELRLGHRQPNPRPGRHPLGQSPAAASERRTRNDAADEPEGRRPLRRRCSPRTGRARTPRPGRSRVAADRSSRSSDSAPAARREPNTASSCRDAQVADERQLEPAGQRVAVDSRDDRFRTAAERGRDVHVEVDRAVERGLVHPGHALGRRRPRRPARGRGGRPRRLQDRRRSARWPRSAFFFAWAR